MQSGVSDRCALARRRACAERLLTAQHFADAIRTSVECLHYISKTFGPDDVRTAHSLTTIGLAYVRSGHVVKGRQYLESAVAFAKTHPVVLDSPEVSAPPPHFSQPYRPSLK